MKRVYFDMDGTLCAYHQHIETLGIEGLQDITCEDEYVEKVINPHFGRDLFKNLEPLPLYRYFMKWLEEAQDNFDEWTKIMDFNINLVFVSFVGNHKHYLRSVEHKQFWLRHKQLLDIGLFIPLIGKYEDRVLLADENSILFDDDEYSVRKWGEIGQSVLVDPYEEYSEQGYEKFKTTINNFLDRGLEIEP